MIVKLPLTVKDMINLVITDSIYYWLLKMFDTSYTFSFMHITYKVLFYKSDNSDTKWMKHAQSITFQE